MIALGGGSVLSERVRERARAPRRRCCSTSTRATAWERVGTASRNGSGAERPLARDRDAFWRSTRERRELYEELADALLPALAPGGGVGRAATRCARSRARRAGTRLLWATRGLGRLPGARRRAACSALSPRRAAEPWPLAAGRLAPLLRDRRDRRALYARAPRRARGDDRDRARRARQDAGRAPSSCGSALRRRRDDARRSRASRSAAASSATWPASAPPPTSAACRSCRCRRRSSPRSTPPTAARPASTCPRPRTTSAPTTSRPA